jgi:hypothetical protein
MTAPGDMGYRNGMTAATATFGEGPLPRPVRPAGYSDAQWAEYKAGWAEALDDYERDNG